MNAIDEVVMHLQINVRRRINARDVNIAADRINCRLDGAIARINDAEVRYRRIYLCKLKAWGGAPLTRQAARAPALPAYTFEDGDEHLILRLAGLRACVKCYRGRRQVAIELMHRRSDS